MATPDADVPAEGDVITRERTFTVDDVREFGAITGDQQSIHTDPDEDGRLVVQGLLTGSLMTEIGGEMGYIARSMELEFRKPVYTGDSITCECTVDATAERDDRYDLEIDVEFRNESGAVVADAHTTGLVWKDNPR